MKEIKPIKIVLTTTVHATEDKLKVLKALLNVIPPSIRENSTIREVHVEGHYGNPIILLNVSIEGYGAEETFKYIIKGLSGTDRKILSATLDMRVDESNRLHIRISKQQAYLGNILIYDGDDVVKIVVHFMLPRLPKYSIISELKKLIKANNVD